MLRTVFAIAAALVTFAAVSGTSQATPIAPLSAGIQSETGNLTPVYYYYHRYYGHRRCWVGAYGRWHCRYY
jgi:hypothetical protein